MFLILKIMKNLLAKIKNNNYCSLINKFVNKICFQKFTIKNEKLNGNANIYNISHLHFDML